MPYTQDRFCENQTWRKINCN